MRKVIVQQLVSIDGFVADTSGGLEFFETVQDYSQVDQENVAILRNVDAILLGADTYRLFVEYWPTADDEVVAPAVNSIPKIVFSSTLDSAPWGRHEPARILDGDAVAEVRRLREEPGQGMMVWGSISLTQSLLKAGLVDEIQLRAVPVALGSGRTLFGDAGPRALSLLEARPFDSGIVSLRYAVDDRS